MCTLIINYGILYFGMEEKSMQKLKAIIKIWIIIQLVKRLDVTVRHPKRYAILDPLLLDEVLVLLRENTANVVGYGLS